MDPDNVQNVKVVVRRIAMLMVHQPILPNLKEELVKLYELSNSPLSGQSGAYVTGAYDALSFLISDLEEKGQ